MGFQSIFSNQFLSTALILVGNDLISCGINSTNRSKWLCDSSKSFVPMLLLIFASLSNCLTMSMIWVWVSGARLEHQVAGCLQAEMVMSIARTISSRLVDVVDFDLWVTWGWCLAWWCWCCLVGAAFEIVIKHRKQQMTKLAWDKLTALIAPKTKKQCSRTVDTTPVQPKTTRWLTHREWLRQRHRISPYPTLSPIAPNTLTHSSVHHRASLRTVSASSSRQSMSCSSIC